MGFICFTSDYISCVCFSISGKEINVKYLWQLLNIKDSTMAHGAAKVAQRCQTANDDGKLGKHFNSL